MVRVLRCGRLPIIEEPTERGQMPASASARPDVAVPEGMASHHQGGLTDWTRPDIFVTSRRVYLGGEPLPPR